MERQGRIHKKTLIDGTAVNDILIWDGDSWEVGDSPTFVGLTITGCSVLGLNSAVFQPTTDSTTFFQVLDADGGTPIFNVDSTNERVGIKTGSPEALIHLYASGGKRDGIAFGDGDTPVYIYSLSNGVLAYVFGTVRAFQFNVNGLYTNDPNGAAFRNRAASLTVPTIVPDRSDDNTGLGGDGADTLAIIAGGNTSFSTNSVGLSEILGTTPYLTLHNSTHEDTDGGRESRLNFKGEQGVDPFEETTLARIEASHDGSGADDKGKIVDSVNTGAGLVEVLRRDSSLAVTTVKNKITPIGGIAVKLTNKTGANSIAGYCVTNSNTTADAVRLVPIDEPNPIGVFLDSGISDGSEAWVVVSGIADVYFWGSTTLGDMARTGLTADTGEVAGQATSEASPTSPFAVDKHFCEVGHVLESRIGAGLARCVLHFN